MSETCKDCRHWTPFVVGYRGGSRVAGTCSAIRLYGTSSLRPDKESEGERMKAEREAFANVAAVLETEGFDGAVLETAPDFGCNLWTPSAEYVETLTGKR